MLKSLHTLFNRDLTKLEEEISSYPNDQSLWSTKGTIKNSGGNLALHLCGNLQHFIGKILGGSDYERDRDHEFAAKDIPKEKLLTEIASTKKVVLDTLENLDEKILSDAYPQEVFGYAMTTDFFLVHLSGHLMYHLGQINYHRRMIDQ